MSDRGQQLTRPVGVKRKRDERGPEGVDELKVTRLMITIILLLLIIVNYVQSLICNGLYVLLRRRKKVKINAVKS